MKILLVSVSLFVFCTNSPVYSIEDENIGTDAFQDNSWSYIPGQNSPDQWPTKFKKCAGQRQSPIDISTTYSMYDPSLNDINFITVEEGNEVQMGNSGHSVYLSTDTIIHVEGGGLNDIYQVFGPHFHWGNKSSEGSEHAFDNGQTYPLEMHIVTFDAEKYSDITKAIASGDGKALAVFGVLFTVGAKNNTQLEPITNELKKIKAANSTDVSINNINILDLLPQQTSNYYRYIGSLTTPECHEVVIWTLFDEKISISEYQLNEFRNLLDATGEPLVNNYRPVQPRNGRAVSKSFQTLVFAFVPDYENKSGNKSVQDYGNKSGTTGLFVNIYITITFCVLSVAKWMVL